jgi:neutral ceramidase
MAIMHMLLLLALWSMDAMAALRAGAAAVDITPLEWPVRLIGNFGITMSKQAHDPLHVRAIVLDDGATKIAIALVDSCYVKREELDRAKSLAAKRTAIPVTRMLISATHTHSAPPSRANVGNALEERYVERLVTQTAEAIAQANSRLAPARIGWSVVPVPDELFNRRWFMKPGSIPPDPFGQTTDMARMNPPAGSQDLIHPAGPTDPGFSIVSIETAVGKPLALLANYSLHYVGGIGGNMVSADYFGEFSKLVGEKLAPGQPFVAMLTNGTSGDVNNIDFLHPRPRMEPFQRIREVAGKLAGHAVAAAGKMQYRTEAPIRMAQTELRLRYRRPTAEQMRFAQAALREPDETKLPRNAKAYAERAMRLQEGPETADLVLQAVRIGELGIAAIPCETFTEIGLSIKELSPMPTTFTIELANGHYGYLPTPRHYALGGYETWLGTNNLEPQAAPKILKKILELLEQVRN